MAGLDALSQMAGVPNAMSQMLQQQEESYAAKKAQMEKLQELSKRSPETDEAERWASMATAASKVPPMVGGFGQLLASIGGAYGNTLAQQNQREFEKQQAIAKLMDQGMMGQGSMTALTSALLNPIQNIGGVGISRFTGQTVVPKGLEQVYTKTYDTAYKAAIEQRMPNPEAYAKQQADAVIQQHVLANPSIAGSLYAQRPGEAPLPSQGGAQREEKPRVELASGTDVSAYVKSLQRMEQQAVSEGDYSKAREIQSVRKTLQEQPTAAPSLAYKDVPKAKMEESQAEAVGKELTKEATTLNNAMSASNKMITQINLLEKLYSTPNMPEGELGPLQQQIRSGMKTLGIDVGKEVGAADMARAIASNFALHLRTGEGENLLPGQMSNYEDKLLQQMSPVLSLTNEGRLALARMMKEMATSNARMGSEVNKMTDERGIVDPNWRKRKERVMKEEMARLELVQREIMKSFQGAK